MTDDEKNAKYIIGYYDRENILKYAYLYSSKKDAMEEFAFDPEKDPTMETVFLAKIIRRQERKKIEKYLVTTVEIESGKIVSDIQYSISEDENDPS